MFHVHWGSLSRSNFCSISSFAGSSANSTSSANSRYGPLGSSSPLTLHCRSVSRVIPQSRDASSFESPRRMCWQMSSRSRSQSFRESSGWPGFFLRLNFRFTPRARRCARFGRFSVSLHCSLLGFAPRRQSPLVFRVCSHPKTNPPPERSPTQMFL
jgi:hypothetical protein